MSTVKKQRGTGKYPLCRILRMQHAPLVRAMQVVDVFDRIQLRLLTDMKFGTVAPLLSAMRREGYIELTGEPNKIYSETELKRNPLLNGVKLNYAKKTRAGKTPRAAGSERFRKTAKWSQFMSRWHAVVKAHQAAYPGADMIEVLKYSDASRGACDPKTPPCHGAHYESDEKRFVIPRNTDLEKLIKETGCALRLTEDCVCILDALDTQEAT